MGKAILTFTINSNDPELSKSINLESGSLFYIDECTKVYKNQKEMSESFVYNKRINSFLEENNVEKGKISVTYVRNNMMKENLPVLLNDKEPIYRKDNFYDKQISEIEKTRKLLHNSKNMMFLKSFLNCKKLNKTTDFNINLNYDEYNYAQKVGLNSFIKDYEYYIKVNELLKYASTSKKLGKLRPVFEDSLEAWKKKMKPLNEEGKYYYSRNLRILINEYNKKVSNSKAINNLKVNDDVINKVVTYNKRNKEGLSILNTEEINNTEVKQKILLEEKVA